MTELILLWILSLPQAWKEEVPRAERERDMRPVAAAIARHPDIAPELVAIIWFETKFLKRIQAGQCKAWECDRGRARGYPQLQKTAAAHVPEVWDSIVGTDPENVQTAIDAAAPIVRRGKKVCGTAAGAASYYARGACRGWDGAAARGALADRLRASLK
jgi:hypothetical protein